MAISWPKYKSIENLIDLKIATSFGGGRLAADMVLIALKDSGYRKHMETVRLRLAHENAKSHHSARGFKIFTSGSVPQAGIFLWCKLT